MSIGATSSPCPEAAVPALDMQQDVASDFSLGEECAVARPTKLGVSDASTSSCSTPRDRGVENHSAASSAAGHSLNGELGQEDAQTQPETPRGAAADDDHYLRGAYICRTRTPSPESRYMFHGQHAVPPPPQWSISMSSMAPPAAPYYKDVQLVPVLLQPPVQPLSLEALVGTSGPPMPQRSAAGARGAAKRRSLGDAQQGLVSAWSADSAAASPQSAGVASQNVLSVGTVGHPYRCGAPCKYARGGRLCKAGDSCDRCHACSWTRSHGGRPRKDKARMAAAAAADGEVDSLAPSS